MVDLGDKRKLVHFLISSCELLNKCKNEDEKVAVSNYIANLYYSIESVLNIKFIEKKKNNNIFGNRRNYRKITKKLDSYYYNMLDSFFQFKDFSKDYFQQILVEVENDLQSVNNGIYYTFSNLSKNDFFDIFYQFMRSIHLDKLFDYYWNNNLIYSVFYSNNQNDLGYTLFNPINKESSIYITDFSYGIHSLFVLAHEFGHIYDFSILDQNITIFNQYYYQSFSDETYSILFERLLFRYMLNNNIHVEECRDNYLSMLLNRHDLLLRAYILSLLDNNYYLNDNYLSLSRSELANIVKDHFVTESDITDFIIHTYTFDLRSEYTYAFGDILSIFLKNQYDDLVYDFNMKRANLDIQKYLVDNRLGPTEYIKYYKDDLKLIKK